MKKRTRNIKPPYTDKEIKRLVSNLEAALSVRVGMPVTLSISAKLNTLHWSSRLENYIAEKNGESKSE